MYVELRAHRLDDRFSGVHLERPHGVARIITAMSQYLVVCATDEPADLDYLRNVLPAPAFARVRLLPFREVILYSRRVRRWYHFGADYKLIASGAESWQNGRTTVTA